MEFLATRYLHVKPTKKMHMLYLKTAKNLYFLNDNRFPSNRGTFRRDNSSKILCRKQLGYLNYK